MIKYGEVVVRFFKLIIFGLIWFLLLNSTLTYHHISLARSVRGTFLSFGNFQDFVKNIENIYNNPEKSLLIFDLDKTLTNSNKSIPPEIIDHILLIMDKGITVAIVSGSNFDSIKQKILDSIVNKAKKDILDKLIIYPNIATERFIFSVYEGKFAVDEKYQIYSFSDRQLNKIIEEFERIKKKYPGINWATRIEKGFACIIEEDHNDVHNFDDIVKEIKINLGKYELEIIGSGRFAIDVTLQNVTKSIAVLDLLGGEDGKNYTYILSFGDSIANKSGDWFLYKPKDDVTIPFFYVGYPRGLDSVQEVLEPHNFFATQEYGNRGVFKILKLIIEGFNIQR